MFSHYTTVVMFERLKHVISGLFDCIQIQNKKKIFLQTFESTILGLQ